MNYTSPPAQQPWEVTHAGHAPQTFHSPTTSSPSINTLPQIHHSLPPASHNKASFSGLSSSQENNIITKLHSFKHHIPLKHDIKYTYAVNPMASNTVYFFEYHGPCAPPPGIGALGTGGGCKLKEPVMNNLILSMFADAYISLQCKGTECLHYSQVSGYVVSAFVFCPVFYLVRLGHSILLMWLLCRDRQNQITWFRLH